MGIAEDLNRERVVRHKQTLKNQESAKRANLTAAIVRNQPLVAANLERHQFPGPGITSILWAGEDRVGWSLGNYSEIREGQFAILSDGVIIEAIHSTGSFDQGTDLHEFLPPFEHSTAVLEQISARITEWTTFDFAWWHKHGQP